MPSIAIVAGEASGDASGAALAAELRRLRPDILLWGAGGPKMRAQGVELVADFSWAGAIGILESLKLAPRLLGELGKLKRALVSRRPDAFVPIDFGAFNVRLGKFAREQAIPTAYYFPPGSWRRRPKDPSSLLSASDKIITPFPWSESFLREHGADVIFPGHPMLDRVAPTMSREEFLKTIDVPDDARVVGLLPGSRSHEIKHILPTLLRASRKISEGIQGVTAYLMPASSARTAGQITRLLVGGNLRGDGRDLQMYHRVVQDRTYDVMAHSEMIVTCSGTATLEAMILGTPMIIVYRGSRAMKFEYLFRKGILEEFIGMPNIIARREICPELLGDQASPEAIAKLAIECLEKPEEAQRLRQELHAARQTLGEPGGTGRAATAVLELAGLSPTA